MYVEDPVFEKPGDENAKIWRYMDFTKFVSLLDKCALFFPRADRLGDPFEGSFSKANVELAPEVYADVDSDILFSSRQQLSLFHKAVLRHTAINSWHLNEYESVSMWKLYLKSNEGIAIRSTFNSLRTSFDDVTHDIYIGVVKYVDYEKDWIPEGNSLDPFVHKRRSFEHERELRVVMQEMEGNISKPPTYEHGIYVPVNLDKLVDEIHLAPTCPEWLFELVKSVTKKYGLNKPVVQSALDAKAIY